MDTLPIDQRVRQRDYLLAIARAMTEARDLRTVLALVLRGAVTMTHGQAGAVALAGEDGNLRVVASYQLEERFTHFADEGVQTYLAPLLATRHGMGGGGDADTYPAAQAASPNADAYPAEQATSPNADRGIVADVGAANPGAADLGQTPRASTRDAAVVGDGDAFIDAADAADRAGRPQFPALVERSDDRQVMALPLELGERVIGQLWVARSAEASAFSALDEAVLHGFAAHAAAAIYNARRFDTERDDAAWVLPADREPPAGWARKRQALVTLGADAGPGSAPAPTSTSTPTHVPTPAGASTPTPATSPAPLARRQRRSQLEGLPVLLALADKRAAGQLADRLAALGARVAQASSAEAVLEGVRAGLPELIVLDVEGVAAPAGGPPVLESLRQFTRVPVIALANTATPEARVQLLDAGADDVLPGSVSPAELVGQAQALLRLARPLGAGQILQVDADLAIDFAAHSAVVRGQAVKFTPTEWRLLYHLVQNAGWLLTHDMILARVWGPEYLGQDNYVRLYVTYLRQKIEPDPAKPRYILTERGVGYRFAAFD